MVKKGYGFRKRRMCTGAIFTAQQIGEKKRIKLTAISFVYRQRKGIRKRAQRQGVGNGR